MIVPSRMNLFDEDFSVVVFHLQSHYIFRRYRDYFSVKWWFFFRNQLFEIKPNQFGRAYCLVVFYAQPDPHYQHQKKTVELAF